MISTTPSVLPSSAAPDAPAFRDYPSKLFVETTSRCNLACPMCVKQTPGSDTGDGELAPALLRLLEPAFPHLDTLILSGVGEPLLAGGLEGLVRRARSLMPVTSRIGLQTNGMLMTVSTAVSLINAGLDQVCISIDAITPEKFRELRLGEEIEAVENAIRSLRQARELCGRPDVRIGVEFVAMRSNLGELPSTVQWAADRGASFAIVSHLLPYDERHAHDVVFGECTDEAIELYRTWKGKGEGQGLDIRRYYEDKLFRKYVRLPEVRFYHTEDQPIFALIEGLKADAAGRGITLDLRKLFNTDLEWFGRVAGIFAMAREVAEEAGIDLMLPEVYLREQRQCNFIEEGSAFVSWRGDVSPCHFLWHRYHCHANGWDQPVRQKVFGNLSERDIVKIWNSEEFRAFRRDALAYDYSSCISCGLAPCNYVQTDEFEQDCHIKNVPCGSCLWSRGVFQCLR